MDQAELEDPYRIEYLAWEDDHGKVYNYSLRTPYPRATATPDDVLFYLYTRSNPTDGYIIKASEPQNVAKSPFNPAKKNLFISHGWNNHVDSSVNRYIRPAALAAADLNVFVVDWSTIAQYFYTTARSAVPSVGQIEADFIVYLIDTYQLAPKDFYLVGHSLGAHVAGCAGAAVQRAKGSVTSIVGLDPAGPLYLLSDRNVMIDETDADAVHVIHTNTNLLGIRSSLGHADYFPNGGGVQPGCGIDALGTCSHGRAYQFYAESITDYGFESLECSSYSNYQRGRCDDNGRSYLGRLQIDKK